jgi:hypothetical protein
MHTHTYTHTYVRTFIHIYTLMLTHTHTHTHSAFTQMGLYHLAEGCVHPPSARINKLAYACLVKISEKWFQSTQGNVEMKWSPFFYSTLSEKMMQVRVCV